MYFTNTTQFMRNYNQLKAKFVTVLISCYCLVHVLLMCTHVHVSVVAINNRIPSTGILEASGKFRTSRHNSTRYELST